MEEQQPVIIVGAGPSGLATAGCLTRLSIRHIILEREDCFGSLWKKYSYERLHLHLGKQFCELPHFSFPRSCPTYVPRKQFIQYLDDYVSHFNVNPLYKRTVQSAIFDRVSGNWKLKAKNGDSGEIEEYVGRFLVVATGETTDPYIPDIEGLGSFNGEVIHSTGYRSGMEFSNKSVLVVGSGNSGMEIALDLANHGAKTSIIVRSPVHFLSRRMVYLGLILLKHLPCNIVDSLMVMLSKLVYGDLAKYGIKRPSEGPFFMKVKYGKYPVIDVGTYEKIKSGEIEVLSAEIGSIKGQEVVLKNGKSYNYDSIVFCTGFKRSTHLWLQGGEDLLSEDGISKSSGWMGKNGLYCVGLSRKGLYGASLDAQNIANHIKSLLI
ncbi:hypothetical protein FEM48_Zijuj09G0030300 [Ziziphus jujuba var. spinosa]|uniref:indole-3-pyruvate monooxygenase n=1 Tax=Ziziphus jujuba var. spinosa TaxID=714518 RepID=A0A978UQI6_ZIZJJ|nr:hypothetical protein FEM48_Zijuj09G0030300 [Ziziphus jujuba var. spinosa]